MSEYFLLPLASLSFPNIDPVIVQIGPLAVHWYGVGYIVGILFAWWYAKRLVTNASLWPDGVLPMKPKMTLALESARQAAMLQSPPSASPNASETSGEPASRT